MIACIVFCALDGFYKHDHLWILWFAGFIVFMREFIDDLKDVVK